MRASAGPKPRLGSPGGAMLAGSYALLAWGCQVVFGDFTVSPEPATEPSEILGTACEPGAYRCVNEVLETCADDRKGWTVAETCESPAACNLNTRNCRACVVGERMCKDDVLERCDDPTTWVPELTCDSAALCSVATDRMSGTCKVAACPVAGAHACANGELSRCSKGQDSVEVVALCETSLLCDAAHADELARTGAGGACLPPACAPNAFDCEGSILKHCALDRNGWEQVEDCGSPDLCSAGRGACGPCTPGETECNGAVLRSCTDGGTWTTRDTCDSVAQCDAEAGSCRRAECSEPGAFRCGSDGVPALVVCSNDRTWKIAEVCSTIELCNATAGRCLPPACAPDETRCRGSRLEQCSRDLTHWELTTTCGADQICDATKGCIPGPCVEGAVRCNGPSLERCVLGRFQEEQLCATTALCDSGSVSGAPGCKVPVCPAGPFFECVGADVRKCLPGRDGFVFYYPCLDGSTCDVGPATRGYECDQCTAHAYECDGMNLVRCSADGQLWQTVRVCAGGCGMTDGVAACL